MTQICPNLNAIGIVRCFDNRGKRDRVIAQRLASAVIHASANQGQKSKHNSFANLLVPAVRLEVACSGGALEMGGGELRAQVHVATRLRIEPTQGPAEVQEDLARSAVRLPGARLGQALHPRQVQGRSHCWAHHCQPLHTQVHVSELPSTLLLDQ